ncbi:alkaline phosphatase PhoX [Microbispora sp. H10670]|uniref:alkaline phosphatase PhoX n=1 Tax=Microbispora sp. H10670 TaxID=2729108 RepID=UPI001601F709|nr:alkaline phosphatase PhoX [Microbispora sp. H10670]
MRGTSLSAAVSASPGSLWRTALPGGADPHGPGGVGHGERDEPPGERNPHGHTDRPGQAEPRRKRAPGRADRSDGNESPERSDADDLLARHLPRALPPGFTCRIVAWSGERTGGVVWHAAPGGGGCFPDGDGWIYVSNCALPLLGGVTALRFAPDGSLRGGYRVLSGADRIGSGAVTPWDTWLSGERTPQGAVFECDPYGLRAPMPRLAMGLFTHGGMVCDPDRGFVYLTEGEQDGCLYRFRPGDWGDLTTGVLDVMTGAPGDETVRWEPVPSPAASRMPVRDQVKGARRFAGGGDCHYRDGVLRFVSEGDGRVWAYDVRSERLRVLHDPTTPGSPGITHAPGTADATGTPPTPGAPGAPTRSCGPGSATAEEPEAGPGGRGEEQIVLVAGDRVVPFLRMPDGWTVTGPSMSPAGDRLYLSCRPPAGARSGAVPVTVEITGPFEDLARA